MKNKRPPREEWMHPKPSRERIRKLYLAFGGSLKSGKLKKLYQVIDEAYRRGV